MGREATGHLDRDGAPVEVSLHLDSQALEIKALKVKGGVRLTFPRSEILDIASDAGVLQFRVSRDNFAVTLGDRAAAWAKALATPPSTLLEKLGLGPDKRAFVRDAPPEPLAQAIVGHTVTDLEAATAVIAVVHDHDQLHELPAWIEDRDVHLPVWVIHGKGASSAPGGNDVRELMRAAGHRDTKICGICAEWSATRYT